VPRAFYRIVISDPPTLMDFASNAAKGRILRNPTSELLDSWSGISVWETEEQARRQARTLARRGRNLGNFIAELSIEESVRHEQTFRPGHYTLWDKPPVLLSSVVRVVPV